MSVCVWQRGQKDRAAGGEWLGMRGQEAGCGAAEADRVLWSVCVEACRSALSVRRSSDDKD